MGGISKHFDGVAALDDVAFDVIPGEVHALVGENGAGKSTLMDVASGSTGTRRGLWSSAANARRARPGAAQELGIGIVRQHPALLPDMTVAENMPVAVGAAHLRGRTRRCRGAARAARPRAFIGARRTASLP